MDACASTPPGSARPTSNACLQCRKVKMRCRMNPYNTKCERCIRKSFDCQFQQHRRGRKPGVRLSTSRRNVVEPSSDVPQPSPQSPSPEPSVPDPGPASSVVDAERSQQDFWTQSNGFQPSDVLNRQAMKGRFSLQNILSTTHIQAEPTLADSPTLSTDDPIQKGLINRPIAVSLFNEFMKHLNPFISQLDSALHTFTYVQTTSSFLLSSVLAAASKALHPSLYPNLHTHAEDLLAESFRHGRKSVEVVQAIMILTYWKEPDDTRAWLSIGYAIRIAMELGWHKLSLRTPEDNRRLSETQARQTRNIERTWLVLFVYDRSISLQTGKPWMIERTKFIESSETWYKHPLANSIDSLLCAFVKLRLITSEIFEMTGSHVSHQQQRQTLPSRSLLRLLDRQIEEWQTHWSRVVGTDGEPCHQFLIPFYGHYARLLIFSSPLQTSLSLSGVDSASVTPEAIWTSCSSALEMLKLVSQASLSQPLYFAQDSVHVMVAYATVFLIKLLISSPELIRKEVESTALESIRNAADTFAKQSAPANTGCVLQARFLENVIREYETIDRRRHGLVSRQNPLSASQGRDSSFFHHRLRTTLPVEASSTHSLVSQVEQGSLQLRNTLEHQLQTSIDSGYDDYSSAVVSPESQGFAFSDDELWTTVFFANAGFSVNEGMFLPSVYNINQGGMGEG